MKKIVLYLSVIIIFVCQSSAQTTEFSYQGNLKESSAVANGAYDFEFRLFADAAGTSQIGGVLTRNGVTVTGGVFAVTLDFGTEFPGANRYLEVRVRPAGGSGFTVLEPRQKVASSPYAIKSALAESATVALNAVTANNATTANTATVANNALQLGGVAAGLFVQTTDVRLGDARSPTAGSPNYIQNQNAGPQTASNFNITGDATVGGTSRANIVTATTQYNLANTRIIGIPGFNNLFFGAFSGQALNGGLSNTFIGHNAGQDTTSGGVNVFVGGSAGSANTTGSSNTFVGLTAGARNTIGSENSFLGKGVGFNNLTGSSNTFLGFEAGRVNTNGESNTFVGHNTGSATTTGSNNVFVGKGAGTSNITGSNNTTVGFNAEVGGGALSYATAIGAGAVATESNSIWLGRTTNTDIVYVPGFIRVAQLGNAGATALCRNANDTISTCSSSLRYKTNINRFGFGLNLINQLKPITFDWKEGGMHDIGLGAEDVAAIEPLLVTYNKKGEVEGVKYDRIGVVLINAVKEQQRQIEELKAIVCELKPAAAACKK